MTTYYVGSGGNDGNAGTSWATRKLTLNGAEDIPVVAGDTVYVGAGTYRETLTVDVSGSAGNPITYIGDYTGANTDGVGGVVRITGSNDDKTTTRSACITSSGKTYRTFRGFALDSSSNHGINAVSASNWTVENMHVQSCTRAIYFETQPANNTVRRCVVFGSSSSGIEFVDTSTVLNNSGNVVENCILMTTRNGNAMSVNRIGNISVVNTIAGWSSSAFTATNQSAGQTLTIYNSFAIFSANGMNAGASGQITENYCNFWGNASNRVNVSAGANSTAYPMQFDVRWLMETVNGGNMVTPFDLASYAGLVELNSGTGAPSADLRGTTVQGSYREWGPLEYDSTLDVEAGSGSGGGVEISPSRGVG